MTHKSWHVIKQDALIWVYTICSGLSILTLRVIMVVAIVSDL